MAVNLRSISDDADYYVLVYEVARRKMLSVSHCTDAIFQKRIIEQLSVQGRELKVLGVGSGSGDIELKDMLQLQKKFAKISHTVVEPAKDHLDKYKKLIAKESSKVIGVTYNWKQQTLGEYRDEFGITNKYDVIFAINCFYYFEDYEGSLMYLREILEEGGILIVILATGKAKFLFPYTNKGGFFLFWCNHHLSKKHHNRKKKSVTSIYIYFFLFIHSEV
ncbi:histamine N-methyltransferase A-like, partial [Anneissia japonica]|uniref:histamine N-methyltransferase A-like n=1 Tax=Anneissia japonica TaxID=1529436 RepID=UPI001425B2DA